MANRPLRRLLIDLLVSPATVIPTVAGFSTLMTSWALSSSASYIFLGFLGILIGVGIAATKIIFNFEKLIEQSYVKEQEIELEKKTQEKRDLIRDTKRNLSYVKDERIEVLYSEFITLYDMLKSDIETFDLDKILKKEIDESIDGVLSKCMLYIQQAIKYDLQISAIRKRNKEALKTKNQLDETKEKIVEKIQKSLEDFRTMVESYHDLMASNVSQEIDKIQTDLKQNLEIAKRVSERMMNLEYDSQIKE